MKKSFVLFSFIVCFVLPVLAQDYKITEPYASSKETGKLSSKSGQKYTYLYDTSLIQAIKLKDESRVKLLMYAQVNPNEKNDEGFTPLYFAAQYLTPETLTLLLDRGARVNLPSKYNLTPLMTAAAAGRADNVKVLLEYGADPNLLDDKEFTALDHAFNNHQLDAAVLLSPVTTVKKPTMNEENTDQGSINLEEFEEEAVVTVPQEDYPLQEQEPEITEEPQEMQLAYNPTIAEIDVKIEKTRQALNRLLLLKKKLIEEEEKTLESITLAPKQNVQKNSVKVEQNTKQTTVQSKHTNKFSSSKFGANR